MSSCEVIPFGGDAKPVEFRNSWGFAPMIWRAVFRHVPPRPPRWPGDTYDYPNNDADYDAMCALVDDDAVPADERIALALTFDWTYVPAALVGRCADALRSFEDAHRAPPAVCHLAAIAHAMEQAVAKGATAIGFMGTSVSGSLWSEFVEEGDDGHMVEHAPPESGRSIADILPDLFPTPESEIPGPHGEPRT